MHTTTQRFLAMASMTLAAGAIIGLGGTAASAAPANDSSTTAVQPRPGNPGGNHNGGNHNGGNNTGGDRWPGGMGNNGGGGRWHGTFDGHRRNSKWVQSWAVDTFRTKKACNFVGWLGEQRRMWDDSDCYRIGRNRYILIAHEYGGRHHRR